MTGHKAQTIYGAPRRDLIEERILWTAEVVTSPRSLHVVLGERALPPKAGRQSLEEDACPQKMHWRDARCPKTEDLPIDLEDDHGYTVEPRLPRGGFPRVT